MLITFILISYIYYHNIIRLSSCVSLFYYNNDDFEKIESVYEEKDLKTESSERTIPLQKWLNDIMYLYMLYIMKLRGYRCKEQLDNEYIFMNSLGNALSSDYLWDTLDRILKKHNFTHLSVYQLRHLFATRCIDVDIPVNHVQQYLGHALGSTTVDYYVGYDEQTNKKQIEKLESINNVKIVPTVLKGMEQQLMSIQTKTA